MKNTTFAITIPHLFSLSSALSVAINSYIITPSFNINETVPKNQSNILIPLFKINKEYRSAIFSFFYNKILLRKESFVIKMEQSKSVLYFINQDIETTLKTISKQVFFRIMMCGIYNRYYWRLDYFTLAISKLIKLK